jgi:hypothetical protein
VLQYRPLSKTHLDIIIIIIIIIIVKMSLKDYNAQWGSQRIKYSAKKSIVEASNN